ncbi:hypothetical protein JTB14_001702 [Gonioctena quinquepunctata]|nr:hypothetical protein JTB14_001702 [Gonioctena quinquepunctata]
MHLKLLVFCAVAIIVVQTSPLPSAEDWNSFKVSYNKRYSSPEDEALHRSIYERNIQAINEHNSKYQRGEVTWKMGVNQFTDMTDEERNRYLGLRRP